ncbi:ABC-F family ATP-binding cassette domain-containing protein [Schinkia azotoformans]|uniref:ABC-F family ATP-binding cassette domain-containing protein n=1 Tax=Schinkia azotoformans TaxID=1454 RepID=UPI002DB9E8FB|nr:ABC-F family ATP-binding cassette domain-containing protein [Schinkia azotoformans]MEC1717392.1 ABC-F family ATP-binding cassette domain-containing protein [Schinkia azotoformans]MEC1740178.1 ABC-F family ATP-binding cassette domain-containing protein [Schinkia azotoformans]MEC1747523.1 ABC-F family ATP-binding cassette domain-containing protein [Schinkia azotoformans]MEC1757270.1 ABC-F family ATP-binding cassette domain-containing protein [Schinkia azotoformans]MEC1765552.1 ABC-F family AT
MNILSVENLSKSFGDKTLFNNISFSVAEKQRIGIIGVNGTGKSTLLKILAGIEPSDAGEIIKPKSYNIEYLAQNPEFEGNGTILDEIFYGDTPLIRLLKKYEEALIALQKDPLNERKQDTLFKLQQEMDAMNAWDANTQAKSILTKLGLEDHSQNVGQLSGGQKKRVAIARSLIQPADLLILDEPTNHLDIETIEWLEEYITRYPGAILLITHDRYFLDRVTNGIFELEQGNLYSYEGNYSTFLEAKAIREEIEAANEDKRQNLLRRELAWMRRGAKARTTKQKARIQRFEELQNKPGHRQKDDLDIAIGGSRLGKKVFEIENISKQYEHKTVIKNFSYIVQPFERIGIVGPNGSGKTSLLNLLTGKDTPDEGTIDVGQTVKIAYYTQENEEMNQEQRVIDYIKETAQIIKTLDGKEITASQMLERFLFSPAMQYTYIKKLSGGERRRLYLLKILMTEPNVIILDEPTNDLDIETLTILEDYLDDFPGVVLTVSHDRYFLDKTCDILFVFEGEGNIRIFFGSYSEYLEEEKQKQELLKKEEAKEKAQAITTSEQPAKPKKLKLSYKEQKEWEGIEDKIMQLEEEISTIQQEIASSGSDFAKVQPLYEKEQSLTTELEHTMERWEELSELVEQIEKQNA